MNKEQLIFVVGNGFLVGLFFSTGKGFSFTAVTADHPQDSLDTVPSVAEGDKQFFSVRAKMENPGLPCIRRWGNPAHRQTVRRERQCGYPCVLSYHALSFPIQGRVLCPSLSLRVIHPTGYSRS